MTAIERRSNLSHKVAQALGRAIVCGEYGASGKLPTEAELCESFGVSRTAVREAVKMLSAKGLVSSKPRQGITVMPEENWNIFDPELLQWSLEGHPTQTVLREFFQMRVAIEPEAASLAARYSSPGQRARIREALDRMRDSPANSSGARAADIEFHIAILYATGNRFYIRMRDFIRTALNVSIRVTTPHPEAYGDTVAAHAGVFSAIESADPVVAHRRMQALIRDAQQYLPEHGIERQLAPEGAPVSGAGSRVAGAPKDAPAGKKS